jgi:AbrB family looped-hinge helix DNA binding protein
MKSRVAERGQITIPKQLRDKLRIRAGTYIDFQAEGGKLVGIKVTSADPVEQVYGILKLKKGTDRLVRELRGNA